MFAEVFYENTIKKLEWQISDHCLFVLLTAHSTITVCLTRDSNFLLCVIYSQSSFCCFFFVVEYSVHCSSIIVSRFHCLNWQMWRERERKKAVRCKEDAKFMIPIVRGGKRHKKTFDNLNVKQVIYYECVCTTTSTLPTVKPTFYTIIMHCVYCHTLHRSFKWRRSDLWERVHGTNTSKIYVSKNRMEYFVFTLFNPLAESATLI